jgi:osmotically-inducible protein OsmY
VDVEKGDVILKGTVKNRDVKRRAEDIAETVMGVKNVENRLRVANTNERIVSPVRSNAREELM